ncbi:MAG: WPE palindromic element domain-containing protein [Wolbachia sp.]
MLDIGIQQNLLQTKRHFQSKNWIPVSSTGMTR